MKTYLINWDGNYAVATGNNIEDIWDSVDGTLGDITLGAKICELKRFDVVDIQNGAKVKHCGECNEPKWFTVELTEKSDKYVKNYLSKIENDKINYGEENEEKV